MMNYANGYNAWLSTQAPYNNLNNAYMQSVPNTQNAQITPQQQNNTIKVYFVTNKQEANSIIPDPNGTPLFFFNKGSNEIYIKQVNNETGLATFKEYKEVQPTDKPTDEKKDKESVNLYKKDFDALNDKIDDLKSIVENLTVIEVKGNKNAK